jgi:DNA-binding NarL/FixJ family response regulator
MSRRKISILIIDDNASFVLRLMGLLGDLNNVDAIHTAGNYEEAFRLLSHTVPDMILLDINLPGRSGISVLKKIKERGYFSKVVLISNHAGNHYREKCIKLGAIELIDKTQEFEKVPAIVAEVSGFHRPGCPQTEN